MRQILFLVTILLASVIPALACQFAPHKPYKFDKNEYIFIGEVTGYVESVEFNRNKLPSAELLQEESLRRTSGLKVRVNDKVFLPTQATEFEVFNYGLGSACESHGIELVRLKKSYPVGTKLMLIAKAASEIPRISETGLQRLEIDLARGLISVTDIFTPPVVNSGLHFDYSKVDHKSGEWFYERRRVEFEIRKDLLRLEETSNIKEKSLILDRLLLVKTTSGLLDFYGLYVRNYPSVREAEKMLAIKLKKDGFSRRVIDAYFACSRSENEKRNEDHFYPICYLP
jgi:hypothetical protein